MTIAAFWALSRSLDLNAFFVDEWKGPQIWLLTYCQKFIKLIPKNPTDYFFHHLQKSRMTHLILEVQLACGWIYRWTSLLIRRLIDFRMDAYSVSAMTLFTCLIIITAIQFAWFIYLSPLLTNVQCTGYSKWILLFYSRTTQTYRIGVNAKTDTASSERHRYFSAWREL